MPERTQRVDGFQVVCGLLGILAGPFLLAHDAPAGWSLLLVAAGIVILSTQWAIARDIDLEIVDRFQIVLAVAGIVCVGIAAVYLTRAADDLPSLFPGHGNSENFRVVPGVVSLVVGLVVLARAVAAAHPHRASR